MRKIIFFFIFFLCSKEYLYAQTLISTILRQEGKFDPVTKQYSPVSKNREESSYFEFDKDFTMFRHLTAAKTSLYFIKSIKENEQRSCWEFDVLSDAGYSYYLIIDMLNGNMRFIYKEKGTTYLTQFKVNKYWVDK